MSAKSNINIEKAFYSLASDIKKRLIDSSKETGAGIGGQSGGGVNVAQNQAGGMGGKCC